MSDALSYLLPVIFVCVAVAGICFLIAAWHEYKAWPEPRDWESKIGRVPPR